MKQPIIKTIHDYIVSVEGKFDYKQNQIFTTKDQNVRMFVLSASKDQANLIISDKNYPLVLGDEIYETKDSLEVETSRSMFGKIVDIYGKTIFPVDQNQEESDIFPHKHNAFGVAHQLLSVQELDQQLFTGINIIDLMIPIGKGQRELIIGDRKTGKTHIALNAVINQAKLNTKCIYVAIGLKKEDLMNIYNRLKEHDVLDNVIILFADSSNAYEQYLSPYIGMAHAENISYEDDVLIIFDDLTKHANIVREMSLLLDKPVGREAMPSELFFLHSSLLERSGNFVNRKTISALPIISIVDNDLTSLIASNVISITDGQIVTSSDLFLKNKLPAIDINLSVSRTGSSVQNSIVRKIAKDIVKWFYAYKNQLKLASMDYELNKEAARKIGRGKQIDKLLEQRGISIYSQNQLILGSQIIIWDLLLEIDDKRKAFEFIQEFITKDQKAASIFQNIINNIEFDRQIAKNYFKYAIYKFSSTYNLNWNIEVENSYIINNEKKLFNEIKNNIGVDNGENN
ncbi:ATP F0F1 synthase subunit alpha [Mycoplasma sp. M5725]|uniref:ATP F0F1 synthase subunit alpha n=1 Tax=Mycoplasma phocimorsus TaxID=3045839 RepID=A0AAJ1PRQ7_9MOLU|nr:ATP F0F1 synthase subunit alpha [Mycoplasma phocimorsus]MDJ1645558.1 ATP F0F1 synthase subunit alpha [Mycoplasma phocimorsus]